MTWNNDQVNEKETNKIIELVRGCLRLDGDVVELGCYKGDTSLLLAEVINGTEKKLWIYDSFEGLPEKSTLDASEIGKSFQKGELSVTKREVKARFLRAGLRVPVIKKAWFRDLGAEDLPEKIALAFLDGDFYESIRDSLRLVDTRMTKGGVIVVHDYNNLALPGVNRAVNEWLKGKNLKIEKYQSLMIISL